MKYKTGSFRTKLALFKLGLKREKINNYDLKSISELVNTEVLISTEKFFRMNKASILAVKNLQVNAAPAAAQALTSTATGNPESIVKAKKAASEAATRQVARAAKEAEVLKTKAELDLEFETFADSVYAYIHSVSAKVEELIGKLEANNKLTNPINNNFDLKKFIDFKEKIKDV